MSLDFNNILRIISAGGGLIIDLNNSNLSFNELLRLASSAGNSGANLIIKNSNSLDHSQLLRISSAGKGNVIFEL